MQHSSYSADTSYQNQGISISGANANVTRRTQVEEQCENLSCAIDRLQKAADGLDARLAGIVAWQDNELSCKPECPDASLVPHADLLRTNARRVHLTADRLERLLSSIEL